MESITSGQSTLSVITNEIWLITTSIPADKYEDANIYKASAWVHTLCLSVILILGITGNALVLKSYLKKENFRAHNIYIVTLACIDIFACTVCAPQQALIYYYKRQELDGNPMFMMGYAVQITFVILSYFGMLIVMATERVKMVFQNHMVTPSKNKTFIKVCITITASAVISISIFAMQVIINDSQHGFVVGRTLLGFLQIVSFWILFFSYAVILVKVLKRRNKTGITSDHSHTLNKSKPGLSNDEVTSKLTVTGQYRQDR